MTDEWIRDVADKRAVAYAEVHTPKYETAWKRGDVVVENRMSFSDGFVEGWAMAQEYFRRLCVDYGEDGVSKYFATVFYGLFTNQSDFKGMEDAFPKTTELIRQLHGE